MRDRYLIVATGRRADFGIFRAPGAIRGSAELQPTLLHLALEEGLDRGVTVAADASDWGVTVVDLLVERPDRATAAGEETGGGRE